MPEMTIEEALATIQQLEAQLKSARHEAVRAFVHGEDKLCLVCGAKEPCELKDDPSSPCTFEPTPMELLRKVRELTVEKQQQAERIKDLEEYKEIVNWFTSLVVRTNIGTKQTPSLKAYIEQLEARVKDLEREPLDTAPDSA